VVCKWQKVKLKGEADYIVLGGQKSHTPVSYYEANFNNETQIIIMKKRRISGIDQTKRAVSLLAVLS
jgi:hypothetical protein